MAQAAEILQVSVSSVYRLIDEGVLKAVRPLRGKILIEASDLQRHQEHAADPEFWAGKACTPLQEARSQPGKAGLVPGVEPRKRHEAGSRTHPTQSPMSSLLSRSLRWIRGALSQPDEPFVPKPRRRPEVIVIGVWSNKSDFGAVTPVGWISEEAIVHQGRVSGHLWRFRNYTRARFWHDELHRAGFHVWVEGATCQTNT